MNIYQFFNFMRLLGDYALDENRILYKVTDVTTIKEYFDSFAPIDKTIQPGFYVWLWGDDITDKKVIEEILQIYFKEQNIIARWRFEGKFVNRYNYLLKIDED